MHTCTHTLVQSLLSCPQWLNCTYCEKRFTEVNELQVGNEWVFPLPVLPTERGLEDEKDEGRSSFSPGLRSWQHMHKLELWPSPAEAKFAWQYTFTSWPICKPKAQVCCCKCQKLPRGARRECHNLPKLNGLTGRICTILSKIMKDVKHWNILSNQNSWGLTRKLRHDWPQNGKHFDLFGVIVYSSPSFQSIFPSL